MAGTPKCLAQYLLTNATTTAATVPASKRWTISMIHVTNVDTVQRTFTLWHVASGDSAADKNKLSKAAALPANDYCEFLGGAVMATGDTLQGSSDANNAISVQLYGIEEGV